ncbi:MAG: TetR/AcrR family transcriptional regulator [Acidobacteriaceae bacterium]|nr:TetR/AcrR family transcriptional regulator [Acidobacteriaceae bacterium]
MAVQRASAAKESPDLRRRIIEAAEKIFVEEGYGNFSMRRVAQSAGCSQMAAYRHFANKEALTQHLCAILYSDFATRMLSQMRVTADPIKQVHIFIATLMDFAVAYPDHYSQIFLIRHTDPEVIAEREQLGQRFLEDIHALVKKLMPPGTSAAVTNTKLRQILTCLHGTAALLIAHPRTYDLTKQRAVRDTVDVVNRILAVDPA